MKQSVLAISERKEVLKDIRKELLKYYEVITFNNLLDGLDMLRESDFDVVLLDQYLTWFNFVDAKKKLNGLGKEFVTIGLIDEENDEVLDELEKAGIYSYALKPINGEEIVKLVKPALANIENVKKYKKLKEKIAELEEEREIIGQSVKIKEVKSKVEKMAATDLPILITGEAGVVKTLVAREIYRKSDRRKKDFYTLNCGTMTSEVLERELFGYERGAFSGAISSKKGILEEIDGGTLFIDEIAGIDIKIQSRILKVIEYGEYRKVGGTRAKRADVRFIVSTDKDLRDEIEKGKFRKDLYHRLNGFKIEVPPLRDRREDIPLLANYFLNGISKDLNKPIPVLSGEVMKYLLEYAFPGNIRELRNMLERMIILSDDRIIGIENLPLEIKMKSDTVENKTVSGIGPLKEILEKEIFSLDDVERVVIAMALQRTRWNKQETAKILGIGRTTLYEKIRKYKLDDK
ncbi:MAG: sigma-54 dependent transcriptional regulator [Fusobacterium sp.]|uniref:sigma-54-dependent transcriptional regulator n=1 Tax=Fusobacterium sp. TaxID=68766 RepID=UPI002A74F51B|nr:sigma-54 dependent transcriptional regulator [Fusobacterium sp.]MDY2980401.1 sigma-54 dependent transcriptional regulator [Fusobacterium sp.]